MAAWIEEIPQWVELYPDWVEGLSVPQWVECGWAEFNPQWIDGPICPYEPEIATRQEGGPGGSNKAGRKKPKVRRGHVISAIQTQPDWYYEALLPEETQEEQVFTDEVESVIVEQDLQVDSFESLMSAVNTALSQIETLDTIQKESKAAVQQYKAKIEENHRLHQEKMIRRRREEEAVLHLLLHI